jgi:hypothetical protein
MQNLLLLLIAAALTVARLFVPTVGAFLDDGLHRDGSHLRRRDADAALAAGRALAAWLGLPVGAVAARGSDGLHCQRIIASPVPGQAPRRSAVSGSWRAASITRSRRAHGAKMVYYC